MGVRGKWRGLMGEWGDDASWPNTRPLNFVESVVGGRVMGGYWNTDGGALLEEMISAARKSVL